MSDGHTIYYELHGSPHGRPALILHGGPGGGLNRNHLHMFDLTKWHVLLFDQRGCGKSTPFGSLLHNTTWDLVEDICMLRTMLGIDTWFVQGGSWGTTLALAYAETYPSHVSGLLLRGACICNDASFAWLYQEGGASEIFPDKWAGFINVLPTRLHKAGWKAIAQYYQKKLTSTNHAICTTYANAWWKWESAISQLIPCKDDTSAKGALALATIENHYFIHDCWLKPDQILLNLHKLRHIPITIVHGRYDMVCPITAAYAIHRSLPHTVLKVVPDAGHAQIEPGTMRELKKAVRLRLPLPLRLRLRLQSMRHITRKKK